MNPRWSFLSLISCLLVVCFSATPAKASMNLLSWQEIQQLPSESAKQAYRESLRNLFNKLENYFSEEQEQFRDASLQFFWDLFSPKALANPRYRCIGGSVLTEYGSERCGKRCHMGFCCDSDSQVICNPGLYGTQLDGETPHCVSSSSQTAKTELCYYTVFTGGPRRNARFDTVFINPENQQVFDREMAEIREICRSLDPSVLYEARGGVRREAVKACRQTLHQAELNRERGVIGSPDTAVAEGEAESDDRLPATAENVENGRTVIDGHVIAQCESVTQRLAEFRRGSTAQVTYYITPLYPDVSRANIYGGRWPSRHARCYNLEGSCITNNEFGNILHNYPDYQFNRDEITCRYGFGNAGVTNGRGDLCLDPCRTIAADQRFHPRGTVVYIPEMRGRTCPQSGRPMDGCFVVGDVGSAIRGQGRFDMFAGECVNFSGGVCRDSHMDSFHLSRGTTYYEVPPSHPLARSVVGEHARFVERGFRSQTDDARRISPGTH